MRLVHSLLAFTFLAACGTATIELGEDSGTLDTADTGSNGAADGGDGGDNGDNGGDNGGNGDSGDNGGQDDGGDGGDNNGRDIEYVGEVDAEVTIDNPNGNDQTLDCRGVAEFTVTSAGKLTGDASCEISGQPVAGELTGSAGGGSVEAEWAIVVGPNVVVVPLEGELDEHSARMDGEREIEGYGSIEVTITASSH